MPMNTVRNLRIGNMLAVVDAVYSERELVPGCALLSARTPCSCRCCWS